MKTPSQAQPDYIVDDSFVKLAEGTLGSEPVITKSPENLDERFSVVSTPISKPNDTAKAEKILTGLTSSPEASTVEKPVQKTEQPSAVEVQEVLSNEEFIKKYGSTGLKRDLENSSRSGDTTGIALDIYSNKPRTSEKVFAGALVVGLGLVSTAYAPIVLAAGGLAPFVIGTGISSIFVIGVPIVTAGCLGVIGYRIIKTRIKEMAFKKNFGKTVSQELGHE